MTLDYKIVIGVLLSFIIYQFSDLILSHEKEMALLHCAPITKHKGIESAKAQVAKYQAMVGG